MNYISRILIDEKPDHGFVLKHVVEPFNTLSASSTKWSNTLKQFVGKSRQIVWVGLTICGLALKGLNTWPNI